MMPSVMPKEQMMQMERPIQEIMEELKQVTLRIPKQELGIPQVEFTRHIGMTDNILDMTQMVQAYIDRFHQIPKDV